MKLDEESVSHLYIILTPEVLYDTVNNLYKAPMLENHDVGFV